MSTIQLRRTVRPEDPAWEAFLDAAPHATVFHRLSFLAYHPAGRFREHHLAATRGDRIVGVISLAEGTVDGERDLRSPYGGSLGGFVLSPELGEGGRRELHALLLAYAEEHGFATVTIAEPPTPYADTQERPVSGGPAVVGRELTHIVPLHVGVIRASARRSARRAERLGLRVRAATPADLPAFHGMLAADKARRGAVPTHSLPELQEIFRRRPADVALHLAEHDGALLGGVLTFRCSRRIELVFYAARADVPDARSHGITNLLYEHVILEARTRGTAWLDLGTSSIGGIVNSGLSFFKESMGGVAFERVTKRYSVREALEAATRAARPPAHPAADPSRPGPITTPAKASPGRA